MVIGLFVYLAGRRWLPPEQPPQRAARAARADVAAPRTRMSSTEVGRLVLLVALIPVLMLSVVGNQQFQNAFPLWSQKHMDLVLFGWDVPVTWLQAVDAGISTATMVLSIAFWRWWATRRREPDELTKMGLGSLLSASAPLCMVVAAGIVELTGQKVSFSWALAYTVLNDLGFANILPVGLALYSRVAPRNLEGLMLGIYYLHLFLGNVFVGWLAGLLDVLPDRQFWGLHAVLVAAAGVLMLSAKFLFGRLLAPEGEAAGVPGAATAAPAR
jgi:POT family proton-dependent oligopeptide transporter